MYYYVSELCLITENRHILCEYMLPKAFKLACEEGTVHMQYANFGRTVRYNDMCPYPRGSSEITTCYLDITDWFSSCHRRKHCKSPEITLTTDPCGGTAKYFEVQYTCEGNVFATHTND